MLIPSAKGLFMYILRSNPKGGRPIKPGHFPLHEDKDGNFGYLIGYDKDGDKFLIPIAMAEQIATVLGNHTSTFKTLTSKLRPKVPWKERVFLMLFGRKTFNNLKEMYADEMEE